MFAFCSFSDAHNGKALGVCIIECTDAEVQRPHLINQKLMVMGLLPMICHNVHMYVSEQKHEEELEVDRFYTAVELDALGYQTLKSQSLRS